MIVFSALATIGVALVLISQCAGVLVRTLSAFGKKLGWGEFTVGFFLLGIATSAPELFIAINAGLEGKPQLSLGNLVGGIVVLFTLLVGLSAVLQKEGIFTGDKFSSFNLFRFAPKFLPFARREFFVKDLILMAVVVLLPLLLIADRELSRWDGLALMVAYGFFVAHAVYDRRLNGWEPPTREYAWPELVVKFGLALAGLLVFSWVITEQSLVLVTAWNVPAVWVGLVVLAVGTNLPELTIILRGRRENPEVVVGDILGSASANILIIGVLAMLFPFSIISLKHFILAAISLAVVSVVMMVFLHTKNRLERWEGAVLIGLYLVYLALEIIW
ncbi:MAG: hypothetical protein A3J93_05475 [Candidatus Magasanikbacteria bacterium RIFOXYC2_FULL_42_28]|uniref:Sodium/calcium exchanger membrane region domain-containing protein n=1 Tax=Candidatus Magasanikbacteria bacterium RIFOXYC2_FULL_42_28 TaxID=1798704 RepID=A0A1F6NVV4_9BACT|nr:MAG: hypothetical protein A3J93_05475 [Candidatus Magasanikbacteria bacterium RIFOXYC2_FULL_42_28]